MSELPRPYPPSGFDAFWQRTVREAHDAPLEFERALGSGSPPLPAPPEGNDRRESGNEGRGQGQPGVALAKEGERFRNSGGPHHSSNLVPSLGGLHDIQLLSFRGIDGSTLHGWLAIPIAHETRNPEPRTPNPAKGFLWIPPYGRESLLPNQYGTRQGFVSLSFNFFGHEAFHQEKYTVSRGYFAEGVESPETWVFRRMFQNAVLAFRVLAAQPEVDSNRLGTMGMSQGAGISIWLGAWCEGVKAVCADMPFLGAMPQALNRNAYRYPLKELIDWAESRPDGKETVLRTLSYFDTLNQATRCQVPTQISLGLKDPAVRPATAEAVFEALPGRKLLRRYEVGHDWYPAMIENNRRWLEETLI